MYRTLCLYMLLPMFSRPAMASDCLMLRGPGETPSEALSRHEKTIQNIIQSPDAVKQWKAAGREFVTGTYSISNRFTYARAALNKSFTSALLSILRGPDQDYFILKGEISTVIFVSDNGWQTDCFFEERKKRMSEGKSYAIVPEAISGSIGSSHRTAVAAESAEIHH